MLTSRDGRPIGKTGHDGAFDGREVEAGVGSCREEAPHVPVVGDNVEEPVGRHAGGEPYGARDGFDPGGQQLIRGDGDRPLHRADREVAARAGDRHGPGPGPGPNHGGAAGNRQVAID